MGIINLYTDCANAVIGGIDDPVPGNFILGVNAWVIEDHRQRPPYRVLTYFQECADCTTRGTTVEPDFWKNSK